MKKTTFTVGDLRDLIANLDNNLTVEIEGMNAPILTYLSSAYFDGAHKIILSQYAEPLEPMEEEPEPIAPDDGDLLDASYINRARV
jgi:hypothetical protein